MKTLQLEANDLGRPTCPDVYIKEEGEEYNGPCAIDNGYGEWLYNWEGAMKECEFTGKRMPTDEEFSEILTTKRDMSNIVYAGYCSSGGSCYGRGSLAYYWSSSVYAPSPSNSWRRYLSYSNASVSRVVSAQTYDFSVRCLKDSSETLTIGQFFNFFFLWDEGKKEVLSISESITFGRLYPL